jgi:hypothetical protein
MNGRFHFITANPLVDIGTAAVVNPVSHHRPAVVQPRTNTVQLVSPLGTVLDRPDFTGSGMDRQALRVTVPEAPNFWPKVRISDERVIEWNTAVVVYPIDSTMVIPAILCRMSLKITGRGSLPVSHSDEEVAVPVKSKARTIVSAALRRRFEYLFDVCELVILEASSHNRCGRLRAVTNGLGEAEVNQAV